MDGGDATSDILPILVQENAALKIQFAEVCQLLETAQRDNSALTTQRDQSIAEIQALKQHLCSIKAQLQAKQNELDDALSASHRSTLATTADHSSSGDESGSLRSKLAEEIAARMQLQQELSELEDMKLRFAETRRELQRLQNDREMESESHAKELSDAKVHYEHRIAMLEQTTNDLQARLADTAVVRAAESKDRLIHELQERVSTLQSELGIARDNVERMAVARMEDTTGLNARLSDLQRERTDLANEMQRIREAMMQSESERAHSDEENGRLHSIILKMEGENSNLRSQIDLLQGYLSTERLANQTSQQEQKQEWERELFAANEKTSLFERRCRTLEDQLRNLTAEKLEATRLYDEKIADLQAEVAARTREFTSRTTAARAEWEAEASRLQSVITEQRGTITSLEVSNRRQNTDLAEANASLTRLTARMELTERQLATITDEKDAAIHDVQVWRERAETLEAQVRALADLQTQKDKLVLQLTYAQRELEETTARATKTQTDLEAAVAKERAKSAETVKELNGRILKLQSELKDATKVIEKQKTRFAEALLKAEKRNSTLNRRMDEAHKERGELMAQLDLASAAVRSVAHPIRQDVIPSQRSALADLDPDLLALSSKQQQMASSSAVDGFGATMCAATTTMKQEATAPGKAHGVKSRAYAGVSVGKGEGAAYMEQVRDQVKRAQEVRARAEALRCSSALE